MTLPKPRGGQGARPTSLSKVAKRTKSKASASVTPTRLKPPTKEQREALVSYMEHHTNFATGRLKGKNAAQLMKKMIHRLGEKVNSVKSGQTRSGQKWWKTWVDMRNHARKYAADNYTSKECRTGGGADESIQSVLMDISIDVNCTDKLTSGSEFIDRIMTVIGWHTALGLDIPDELEDNGPVDEMKSVSEVNEINAERNVDLDVDAMDTDDAFSSLDSEEVSNVSIGVSRNPQSILDHSHFPDGFSSSTPKRSAATESHMLKSLCEQLQKATEAVVQMLSLLQQNSCQVMYYASNAVLEQPNVLSGAQRESTTESTVDPQQGSPADPQQESPQDEAAQCLREFLIPQADCALKYV